MLHKPANHVGKDLAWILKSLHVLDFLKVRSGMGCRDRELAGKEMMNRDVITAQGIWTKGYVIYADKIGDILKVLHVGFDGVPGVLVGQGCMRRCLNANDTALLRAGLQHPVGFQPSAVP